MDAIDELDQKVDLLIQQYRSEKLRADKAEQSLAALQAAARALMDRYIKAEVVAVGDTQADLAQAVDVEFEALDFALADPSPEDRDG